MTNDIQQAYDRAMTHNAMLREAIHKTIEYYEECIEEVEIALNATEADATAWKEAFARKAVEAYLGEGAYPKVCAMAAQIAANRDMLRKQLERISEKLSEDHIEDIKRDPSLLAARLRKVRDMADLVLAWPNASVEKYKSQVIRDYSIDSGLYKLFDYLQEKKIGTLGEKYAVNALNTIIELKEENALLKRDLNDYNHSANLLFAAKDYKEKFGKDKRYEIQKNCGWGGLRYALKQALKIK